MESLLKLRMKHDKFAQTESETWEVCAFISAHNQDYPNKILLRKWLVKVV